MQKSVRLSFGDKIALVNPVGMPPERFRPYVPLMDEYLQKEGFQTKMYLAPDGASEQVLAETFTRAWTDSEIQAVFPICGSDRIYEVMKYLKPEVFKSKPTIFCGSSALSALSL